MYELPGNNKTQKHKIHWLSSFPIQYPLETPKSVLTLSVWPGAIDNIFPLFQSQTQTAFFESSPTETKRWIMSKKSRREYKGKQIKK